MRLTAVSVDRAFPARAVTRAAVRDLYRAPGVARPRSCACHTDAVDEASWYLGDDDKACACPTAGAAQGAGCDRAAPDGVAAKEGGQADGLYVTPDFRLLHIVDGKAHYDIVGEIHDWGPEDPDGPTVITGGTTGGTAGTGGTGGTTGGGGPDGPEDETDDPAIRPPEGPPEGDDSGPKECTHPQPDPAIERFDVFGSAEDAVHLVLGDGDGAVPEADDNASTDTSGDDDYGKGASGVEAPDHISGPEPTGDDTAPNLVPLLAYAPMAIAELPVEAAAATGIATQAPWAAAGFIVGVVEGAVVVGAFSAGWWLGNLIGSQWNEDDGASKETDDDSDTGMSWLENRSEASIRCDVSCWAWPDQPNCPESTHVTGIGESETDACTNALEAARRPYELAQCAYDCNWP